MILNYKVLQIGSRDRKDISNTEDKALCEGSDPNEYWFGEKCGGCPHYKSANSIGHTPIDISYAPHDVEMVPGYSLLYNKCGIYGYNRETPLSEWRSWNLKELKKMTR
jgi:hypothetical protein